MRTEKSLKNIKYSIIGQFLSIVIALVTRKIFLVFLNATYLGINGLFSNILTILSFVELGIGPALTFALYKPLKDKDYDKINILMNLFKKCYILIGFLILIIGVSLTPFLSFFISELPDIDNLRLIYCLFVINTGVSYFGSYKKTLLTSDQNGYIVSIIHYSLFIIMNILQIIVLWITNSFIFYLILQIFFTILGNIVASIYVNKKYNYLNNNSSDSKLDLSTKKTIKKNVTAMVIHKFGSIIVTSTDNIILSKYIGLISVGIYANYYLVINNISKILKQLFNSIIASVGNLGAEGDKRKIEKIFDNINFANYILQSFCSIIMLIIFQDFIYLWVGKDYLFDYSIVIILVLCFYFTSLRNSVLLFKEALGLYWQDRYKAFFEALINLISSIFFVKIFGVIGVFMGTLLSTLTTCFWIEPFVLYKYGFDSSSKKYFLSIFKYSMVSLLSFLICYFICSFMNFNLIINIVLKLVISTIIICIIYVILYRKKEEFKYLVNLIKKILKRK